MGYNLLSIESKKIYCSGFDLNEFSIENYQEHSNWSRSIMSYKSQLLSLSQVENEDVFEKFKTLLPTLSKSRATQKLMSYTINKLDDYPFTLYFQALMLENGLYVEQDLQAAIDIYHDGAFEYRRQDCAERVMMYHLIPSNLNANIPDYNNDLILNLLTHIWSYEGIFDHYSKQIRTFKLLGSFYLQLDLNIGLRNAAQQRIKAHIAKMNTMKNDQELFVMKLKENPTLIDNLILFILMECSISDSVIDPSLKALKLIARYPEFKHLNTLLGDLYDVDFFGLGHPWHFESRLKFYQMANNTKRISSFYELMYFNTHFNEVHIKNAYLEKLIDFHKDENCNFDLSTIYFLLEYYMKGGNTDISKFLDPNIVVLLDQMTDPTDIDYHKSGSQPFIRTKSKIVNEFFDCIKNTTESFSNKLTSDRKLHLLNFTKNFFFQKVLNFKYIVNLLSFLNLFGHIDQTFLMFEMLRHTKDKNRLKMATKIKNDSANIELLPLVQMYEENMNTSQSKIKAFNTYLELLTNYRNRVQKKNMNINPLNLEYSEFSIKKKKKNSSYPKAYIFYRGYKQLKKDGGEDTLTKLYLDSTCALCFKSIEKYLIEGFSQMKKNVLYYLAKVLKARDQESLSSRIFLLINLLPSEDYRDDFIAYKSLLRQAKCNTMSTTLENLSNIILENKLDQSESSDDKQDQKNEAFEFMIAKLTQKDIGKFITYSSLFKKYEEKYFSELNMDGPTMGITNVYQEYFPENRFMGGVHKDVEIITNKYYEKYIKDDLKAFIEPEIKLLTKLNMKLNRPKFIQQMINEFAKSFHCSLEDLNFQERLGKDYQELKNQDRIGKNYVQESIANLDRKKVHINDEDIISFEKKVKKFPQIKLYEPDQQELSSVINLNMPKFEATWFKIYEGLIKDSQQVCTVFAVSISTMKHLNFIKNNLHMLLIYNPLFVCFYGLTIENRGEDQGIILYFISEDQGKNLYEFMKELEVKKTSLDNFEKQYMVYYLVYAVISCHNIGIPILSLNPFNIYIGNNYMVKILVPWFLPEYGNLEYFYSLFLAEPGLSTECFFIPPEMVGNYYNNISYTKYGENCDNLKEMYFVESLSNDKEMWDKILTFDGYCQGITIAYLLTGNTIGDQPKKTIPRDEFINKIYTKKNFESKAKDIIKKYAKIKLDKNLLEYLKTMLNFLPEKRCNLYEQQECLQKVLRTNQLFTREIFLKLIIMNIQFRFKKGRKDYNEPFKQSCHIPTNQIYDGYTTEQDMDSGRFFFEKNLVFTIDFSSYERGTYSFNRYLNETETLQQNIVEGKPVQCKVLIKALSDKEEQRLGIKEFDIDSLQPQKQFIYLAYQSFVSKDEEKITSKKKKVFNRFFNNFGDNHKKYLLDKHVRTKSTTDYYGSLLYTFLETVCNESDNNEEGAQNQDNNEDKDPKLNLKFIDLFGNIILCYKNPDNKNDKINWEQGFRIESKNPKNFGNVYITVPKYSKYHCFSSNILSYKLEEFKNPFISYMRFFNQLSQTKTTLNMTTYINQKQYWGYSCNNKIVEGRLYSSQNDYHSVSQKYIYRGELYSSNINQHYDGFFVGNMPYNYGTFSLKGNKIYSGEINNGIPHGKAIIYSQHTQNIIFIGTMVEGMPKEGVFFELPTVYEGLFYFNDSDIQKHNKDMDKFIENISAIETIINYFNFDNSFKNFQIDGHIINFNENFSEVEGKLSCNDKSLNGMMKVIDRNGTIYHGNLKNTKRDGFGIMIIKNIKMIGYWKDQTFKGNIHFDDVSKNTKDLNTLSQIVSKPKKLEGKLIVDPNGGIHFISTGRILFADGSFYVGNFHNNNFNGIGTYTLSDGSKYEGHFLDNAPHGIGQYTCKDFTYEGSYKRGLKDGFGIFTYFQSESIKSKEIKGLFKDDEILYAIYDYPQLVRHADPTIHKNSSINEATKEAFTNPKLLSFREEIRIDYIIFKPTQEDLYKDQIQPYGYVEYGFDLGSIRGLMVNNYERSFLMPGDSAQKNSSGQNNLSPCKFQPSQSSNSVTSPLKSPGSKRGKTYLGRGQKTNFVRISGDPNFYNSQDENSYCFIGEMTKDNKAIGIITGDSKYPIFQGMLDTEFKNSVGVYYDTIKDYESVGYFQNFFKLKGYGKLNMGSKEYIGNFENGLRNKLCLKYREGSLIRFEEFKNDQKHGISVKIIDQMNDSNINNSDGKKGDNNFEQGRKISLYRMGNLERIVSANTSSND